MTISSTTARNDYTATAGQTVFPYTFKILTTGELKVYVDGTLKTETTHYTVSGATVSTGGNVTFIVALTGGEAVAIVDVPDITQLTKYIQNDAFPAATHENALDKLTRICLYLKGQISRSLLLPIYSTVSDLALPTPSASKVLAWNAAGTALENFDLASIGAATIGAAGTSLLACTSASQAAGVVGISDFMKTVNDDTTSAAALATLGFSPFIQRLASDTTSLAARATLGSVIVQIVNSTETSYAAGTTIMSTIRAPQKVDGDQYMTCSITPTNAAHYLLVDVITHLSNGAGGGMELMAALFKGTDVTALATGIQRTTDVGYMQNITFKYYALAGAATSTTFKVRAGGTGAGTTYLNSGGPAASNLGGTVNSSITITEIAT